VAGAAWVSGIASATFGDKKGEQEGRDMHKTMLAIGLLAIGGSAAAQNSSWGYFENEDGLLMAGVQTADGEQLIFKCDEAGKGSVMAVVVPRTQLAPPQRRAPARIVRYQVDGGSVEEDQWRYYPEGAMAMNTNRERTLPRFLREMADGQELKVTLLPQDAPRMIITFNVTGAREALDRVYQSCGDENPLD
jgi:hypothetical protein